MNGIYEDIMHAYIIHDNNVCEGLTWTWCWWQKFCCEEQIGALQMHISDDDSKSTDAIASASASASGSKQCQRQCKCDRLLILGLDILSVRLCKRLTCVDGNERSSRSCLRLKRRLECFNSAMAMMTLCAYCYWCSRSSFSRSKPSKCMFDSFPVHIRAYTTISSFDGRDADTQTRQIISEWISRVRLLKCI